MPLWAQWLGNDLHQKCHFAWLTVAVTDVYSESCLWQFLYIGHGTMLELLNIAVCANSAMRLCLLRWRKLRPTLLQFSIRYVINSADNCDICNSKKSVGHILSSCGLLIRQSFSVETVRLFFWSHCFTLEWQALILWEALTWISTNFCGVPTKLKVWKSLYFSKMS